MGSDFQVSGDEGVTLARTMLLTKYCRRIEYVRRANVSVLAMQ